MRVHDPGGHPLSLDIDCFELLELSQMERNLSKSKYNAHVKEDGGIV
jgi:hypothetical protein